MECNEVCLIKMIMIAARARRNTQFHDRLRKRSRKLRSIANRELNSCDFVGRAKIPPAAVSAVE